MTHALYSKSSEVILCFSWGTDSKLSCFGAFCFHQSLRLSLFYLINGAEARTFCSTNKSHAGLEDMTGSSWYFLRWTTPKTQTCSCMSSDPWETPVRGQKQPESHAVHITERIQVSEECYSPWDPCGFKHTIVRKKHSSLFTAVNSIHRAYESS